ncbi:hypothetical protein THTE_0427 [Thermogutta terrifontis]|uniref:Uncharacterized protein n=1 Tax=Thermogutta terrifontis TaxID=1331910 RepID=A0A286RAP9_9BACT|nr:hypothetical protein THTE_0427 [Thermogutta terrifontis]
MTSESVGAIHELPLPVDSLRGRGKARETAMAWVELGPRFGLGNAFHGVR